MTQKPHEVLAHSTHWVCLRAYLTRTRIHAEPQNTNEMVKIIKFYTEKFKCFRLMTTHTLQSMHEPTLPSSQVLQQKSLRDDPSDMQINELLKCEKNIGNDTSFTNDIHASCIYLWSLIMFYSCPKDFWPVHDICDISLHYSILSPTLPR